MTVLTGIGMTSQRTRDRMVRRLAEKGIRDPRVLQAMAEVPRHLFVDEALAHRAYEDTALPISHGQTISQPWIVAKMTEAILHDGMPEKVLELGTGSGYQAAVLSRIVPQVFSIERIDALTQRARKRFRQLGYRNIRTKTDDGYKGWPSEAPFDVIFVTAAPENIPEALFDQLAEGGRMIVPVGKGPQDLLRLTKTVSGIQKENLGPVLFVPLLEGVVR